MTTDPRTIAAALFDLDGTLVDNMRFHAAAWMAFCRRHGLSATQVQFEREHAGKKNEEILPLLFARPLKPEESRALAEQKEEDYRREYAPHLKLVDGAQALLERLRERGVPAAIASAAPPLNRKLVIEGLQLGQYLRAIVGAEQAARGKPFPDIFLAAARAVGVEPSRCVVFEDALHGVTAGKAAGMLTVGITTIMDEAALRAAGADAVIHDFTRLPERVERALFGDPAT